MGERNRRETGDSYASDQLESPAIYPRPSGLGFELGEEIARRFYRN
jgi:hypothetical protein